VITSNPQNAESDIRISDIFSRHASFKSFSPPTVREMQWYTALLPSCPLIRANLIPQN
jgi:hypothetical protein